MKRCLILIAVLTFLLSSMGCNKPKEETEAAVQEDFWIYLLGETASEYEIIVTSGRYKDNRFEGYAVSGIEKLDEDKIARFLFQRKMFEGRDLDEMTIRIEVKDHEDQIIKETELTYPFEEVFGKTQFIRFNEENDKPIINAYKLTELR